jgi:5-methyltetrahydropteroyltriglutamate--homocysteine methyltransferase
MAENGRILTTHVGSLPRPQDVVDVVFAEDKGEEVDPQEYERVIGAAVKDRVRHQVDSGVDIVSDGEMSKIGYATFIRHRLSGFEVGDVPRATPADLDAYPSFRDRLAAAGATAKYLRPICRGPIAYENREPLERDLEHLRNAIEGQPVAGAFMNAPSPGIVALFQPNEYYDSTDAYLDAIAEAMKTEYEGIVEAGFYLQIDAPDLAMGRHIMYRDEPDEVFVERAAVHVDAINQALRDVPGDRVRVHLCWGNYEGPHHLDIELEKIFADVMRLKASALQFEASNPRHAHEWAVWKANADKIPDDKVLIPGVLDTTANYIEHPALVAERLGNFVDIVGADRVIAGTDCGFGTWAGFGPIDPTICWAKLASMAEGAKLATERARLGCQQHLPAQPAGLVELVGARGLLQRQHLGDARTQAPGLEVRGQRTQLLRVGLHEHSFEAHVARRLGGPGRTGEDGDPALAQARGGLRAERDRIEDGVDRADRRKVGGAGEDLGRAERGDPLLVVVRGLREHPAARTHRQLGGEATDRAAGAGDQQGAARRRGDEVEGLPSGERVERQGRRRRVVDGLGQGRQPRRVDRRRLRVGAHAPADPPEGDHAEHAVAGAEVVDVAAHRGHLAREVPARHERRRQVGHPRPRLARSRAEIGRVDVRRADAHDDLTGRRRGVGALREAQDLGTAEGAHLCHMHAWKDP